MRHALPFVALAACAIALFPLQRWIDARVPPDRADEKTIYVTNGDNLKVFALGYDSLLSDVYWIRAIQFLGSEVLADRTVLNTPRGRLDPLYPLIDVSTTLDPRGIPQYRFGGFFVHDYVDMESGRKLLEKGIRANPENFRLYQDLAYLSWSDGDCDTASRYYAMGAAIPGSPEWMKDMSATILAKCGRTDLTIELLTRQYESTDDPRVREELAVLLEGYQALFEVQYLAYEAGLFRNRTGAFPTSLAQLARTLEPIPGAPRIQLDRTGAPADPNGTPYLYDPATGAVTTDPNSIVLPNPRAGGGGPQAGR
jgi:hypothetical protein